MFENSLMILKTDYIHKRKPVLLKLLAEDFQIQGQRKLIFSPELAAEFYADKSEEEDFMIDVILLSKGPVEAFILTKEDAVPELLRIMICYFQSASEMEQNVHVTKERGNVAREINFIFPNYIHEPTPFFERENFCNRPMLKPLLSEIYEIMQNVDCTNENWRVKVADYLNRSNSKVPIISNQCMPKPDLNLQERAQQTIVSYASPATDAVPRKPYKSSESKSSPLTTSSPHSSMLLTSSSCVTCGGFERTEPCIPSIDLNRRLEGEDKEKVCEDEEIIWKEVIVYEEVLPEEEEEGSREARQLRDMQDEGEEEGGVVYLGIVPSDVEIGSGPIQDDEPVDDVKEIIKKEPAVDEEPAGDDDEPAPSPVPAPPPPAPAPPPAEEPPAEKPPAEKPPAEVAEEPQPVPEVVEEPPAEEPPAEEPPAEEAAPPEE